MLLKITKKQSLIIIIILIFTSSMLISLYKKLPKEMINNTNQHKYKNNNSIPYTNYRTKIKCITFQINVLNSVLKQNNDLCKDYTKLLKNSVIYYRRQKSILKNRINIADLSILYETNILKNMKNIIICHPYDYLWILNSHNYSFPKLSLYQKNKYLISANNMKTYFNKIDNSNVNINSIFYQSEESLIGIGNITSLISCSTKLIISKININYNNIFYFSKYLDDLRNLDKYKNNKTYFRNHSVNANNKLINNNKVYFQGSPKNKNNALFGKVKSTEYKISVLYDIMLPFGSLGFFTIIIIMVYGSKRLQKLIKNGRRIPSNPNKLLISIPIKTNEKGGHFVRNDNVPNSIKESDINLSTLVSGGDSTKSINSLQDEFDSDIVQFVNNLPCNIPNQSCDLIISDSSSGSDDLSTKTFSTSSLISRSSSTEYSAYPSDAYIKVYTTDNALPYIDSESDTSSIQSILDHSLIPYIPDTLKANIFGHCDPYVPDSSKYTEQKMQTYSPFSNDDPDIPFILDNPSMLFFVKKKSYQNSDSHTTNEDISYVTNYDDVLFPQVENIPISVESREHSKEPENIQREKAIINQEKHKDDSDAQIHCATLSDNTTSHFQLSLNNTRGEMLKIHDVSLWTLFQKPYIRQPERLFVASQYSTQLLLVNHWFSLNKIKQDHFLSALYKKREIAESMKDNIFNLQIINYLQQKNISLVGKTSMPSHNDIVECTAHILLQKKKMIGDDDNQYDVLENIIKRIIFNKKDKHKYGYSPLTTHGWFRKPLKNTKMSFKDYELTISQYELIKDQDVQFNHLKKLIGNIINPMDYKKELLEDINPNTGEFKTIDAKSVIVSTTINEILYDLEEIIDTYKSYLDITQICKLKFLPMNAGDWRKFNYISHLNKHFLSRKGSDIKHTGISEDKLFDELSKIIVFE